jgi:hypothetical protein
LKSKLPRLKKKSKLVFEKREGAQTLLPVFLSQFGNLQVQELSIPGKPIDKLVNQRYPNSEKNPALF